MEGSAERLYPFSGGHALILRTSGLGLGVPPVGPVRSCAVSIRLLLQQSHVCLGGSSSLSGAACGAPWAGALLGLLLFLADLTK